MYDRSPPSKVAPHNSALHVHDRGVKDTGKTTPRGTRNHQYLTQNLRR